MNDSERFMKDAIGLAVESVRAGGGPFGAVVVRDGVIVGRGMNRVTSAHDPTAHAEVMAIRDACSRLGTHRLDGCELFVSCEPCPMCLGALYWARLDGYRFAATRQDAAEAGFDDDQIHREMALPEDRRALPAAQLMREEALAAFAEWQSKPDRVPY